MKKILILAVVSVALAARCLAQIPVTDAANLSQNIINYAALINQLSNQAQQITNQVQQIQQMDNQLSRMGNMANITAVIGFPQLQFDQSSPTQIQTWSQNLATVNGSGIFGDSRGGIYQPVAGQFTDFNGAAVERDPNTYMPAQSVTSQVDNFKSVQTDIYARRQALKTAIAQTSDALQAATTDAEEQKLEAVLSAQYSQLASLDSEVELSAAEVQVKMAEANAMASAQTTADAEARRTLAQQEGTKIGSTFKRIYASILTYVSERPLAP